MNVKLLAVDGDDRRIAERARLSYDRDDADEYEGLVRYLMEHWHSGPFQFCSMQFEVTASLAVVRQLTRHRTFSFNEVSMRYVEPPETSHYPASWRIQGGDSKQGSIDGDVDYPSLCHHMYNTHIWQCRQLYDRLIENKVCREQARLVIPQAQHTRIVVKADLHNLLHYLRLRLAPDCQAEHRAVAEEIARHVAEHFPVAWAAFQEFRLNAVTFSTTEMIELRAILAGGDPPAEILGSKRRARVFMRKLNGMEEVENAQVDKTE